MHSKPRILDDLAQVAGGAVSLASGLRSQIREDIKIRIDDVADRMNFVPREDLERVEALLAKTQTDLVHLTERLEALEKQTKKT